MLITRNNIENVPAYDGAEVVSCKNGLRTILLKKGGGERFIHSKYDPVREARAQTAEFLSGGCPHTVIVFGLGLAYHLHEILNALPEGGEAYVFEPRGLSCAHFAAHGETALLQDERVKIFSFSGSEELNTDLRGILTLQNCDAFRFFAHPVYASSFPKEYDMLAGAINAQTLPLSSQKATVRLYGKLWSTNFINNYPFLFGSAAVKGLFGAFSGKAAIIVSAGPSLSKNVGLLRGVNDRAVIICTDTAFKALEAINVRPHLLVTTSGNLLVHEKLRGSDYSGVPLVYKSQSHHEVLKNHEGRKFYSGHINTFLDDALRALGKPPGEIDSGGSVACSCLDLAAKTGAKTIIFIGQDLALTGGEGYAKDVFGHFSESIRNTFAMETEDIYGQPVLTLQNLNMYRLWTEDYIKTRPDVRFIDATEGGALIRGTDIMTLKDALGLLGSSFDADKTVEAAFTGFSYQDKKTSSAVERLYVSAKDDLMSAREFLRALSDEYNNKGALSRTDILDVLDKLYIYTESVRYAVLADIFDIGNMPIGKAPDTERELFKKIDGVLEELLGYLDNPVALPRP